VGTNGEATVTTPQGVNLFAQYPSPNGTQLVSNAIAVQNNQGWFSLSNTSGQVTLKQTQNQVVPGHMILEVTSSITAPIQWNITKGNDATRSRALLMASDLPPALQGQLVDVIIPLNRFFIGIAPYPLGYQFTTVVDTDLLIPYDLAVNTKATISRSATTGGYSILVT